MRPKPKLVLAAAASALACVGAANATLPPGADYPWVQLPAWIGTTASPTPLPTASYPWVQPPAWIPAR